jgi:flagellin
MPVKISHNANLHRITRSMSVHYDRAANQIEQLSSGNRVNRSSDDPSSLALADTLASEVRVLTEGNRNIQQSIHMLQVADGALSDINDMVLRMRSLAVQASTANFNDRDRENLDSEFQALRQEIDRIAEATNFNGIKLLETNETYAIQAGPTETSNDVSRITIGDMRASGPNLNITGHTVRTLRSAQETMQHLIQSHDIVIEERNRIAAFTNRLEFSINTGLNIVERMKGSEAEIRGVDLVRATSALTRSQIMTQAAGSFAVAADLDIDRVLSLLG